MMSVEVNDLVCCDGNTEGRREGEWKGKLLGCFFSLQNLLIFLLCEERIVEF